MRRWGGSSDASSGYGGVLGNRYGLCNPGVGSWGVDGAASIRLCKIGEGRRGKLGVGGLMLRIVRGLRLLDEAAYKKGALSLLK